MSSREWAGARICANGKEMKRRGGFEKMKSKAEVSGHLTELSRGHEAVERGVVLLDRGAGANDRTFL